MPQYYMQKLVATVCVLLTACTPVQVAGMLQGQLAVTAENAEGQTLAATGNTCISHHLKKQN